MEPANPGAVWFVHTSEGQKGPFSLEDLRREIAGGLISAETLVWREGMANWAVLKNEPELAAAILTPAGPPSVPVATEVTTASPDASSTRSAGPTEPRPPEVNWIPPVRTKRKRSRAPIAVAVLLLLVGCAGAAAWYWVQNLPEPVDLAAQMPPDARFYFEIDASDYDESRQKTLTDFADYLKKHAEFDEEPPDLSRMGCRMALAVYGTAHLQGVVPGVALYFIVDDPEGFHPFRERLMEKANVVAGEDETEDGWTIRKGDKPLMMGIGKITTFFAEKNDALVITTSRNLLSRIIALSEKKDLDSLAVSSRFLSAFGLDAPPAAPGLIDKIRAALSETPKPKMRRTFLDLQGILEDFHPLLRMFGGKAYGELKERYLDTFLSYTTLGDKVGPDYTEVSELKLTSDAEWLKSLESVELYWPGSAPDDAWFSAASGLPKGWTEGSEEVINELLRRVGSAQIAKTTGDIGRINGLLAAYSAEHDGAFPASPQPSPITSLDLQWENTDPPVTLSWGGEFLYESDKKSYILYAVAGGESVIWYSSELGTVETSDNAAAKIAEARFLQDDILERMEAIREAAVCVLPKNDGGLIPPCAAMLRTDSVEVTEELASYIAGMIPPIAAPFLAVRPEGHWISIGVPEALDSISNLLASSTGRSGVFSLSVNLPMRQVAGKEDVPDVTWRATVVAAPKGNSLTTNATIKPDPHPAMVAAIITGLFAKTPAIPLPIHEQ